MSELVCLAKFREDPDNVSEATDEEIGRLADKLKRVPQGLTAMRIAYVTDAPGGGCMVISGNKRLRCLKAAYGESGEVPAEWFQDVTSMTAAERHEFRLNANISDGHWNLEKLLDQYSADELEMAGIGDLIKQTDDKPTGGKTDADAVPEVVEVPKSERGKVYRLGDHLVMCGDSCDQHDVSKISEGGGCDLLITDPPYNVDYKGAAGKIMNDSMKDSQFLDFLTAAFKAADSAMKPGAAFYVWHADSEGYNFRGAARAAGWTVRQCLVWVKNSLVLGRQDYQWIHEPCLYGWKDGAAHKWRGGRKQTTVHELVPESVEVLDSVVRMRVAGRTFQLPKDSVAEVIDTSIIPMDRPTVSKLHPTMKPVALFAYQIRNSSEQGAVVLDLFGGSGTTVIACEDARRRARVMELDPHFVDVIRKRWAEYVHGEGCDWESLTPEVQESA